MRGKSPPSGERWLREGVGSARKITTVWRTVATGVRWKCEENHHRLANGGYGSAVEVRGKSPPTGERWLREGGGYGRTVATGERWLRANGGYGRAVATGSALLSHESDGFGNGKTFTILPFDPSVPGLRMLADKTPRFRG